jgi:hypothetical protein
LLSIHVVDIPCGLNFGIPEAAKRFEGCFVIYLGVNEPGWGLGTHIDAGQKRNRRYESGAKL